MDQHARGRREQRQVLRDATHPGPALVVDEEDRQPLRRQQSQLSKKCIIKVITMTMTTINKNCVVMILILMVIII